MRKEEKVAVFARQERLLMQKRILKKVGRAAIQKAKRRLCAHCFRHLICVLLPLQGDGSDCIYFQRKAVKAK